jgi:phosphinothricin acetyltransferase
MGHDVKIRPCEADDVAAICEIYNHYIANTVITFEETPLQVSQMAQRIQACTQRYPWLVCEDAAGLIVGYAYASKWKERAAYKHTAESTVYVRAGHGGQGHGKALYAALLEALPARGCHVVLGCIALPNAESVGLHEHFGFEKVAHFTEVGRKFEQWLDVGYWRKAVG